MSSAAGPPIRLPSWMAQRARDVLEGRKPPVEPRDAATVSLLAPRLVGDGNLLRPWARSIPPVNEGPRSATRFFPAALPAGQRARDVSGGADDAAWVEPAAALAGARRREILLLPPTAVTLGELD